LRSRDFAILWSGDLISQVGDWVLLVALPFYIYQRTGSTLATGGALIAETLPMIALGSVAGVFVDRWDRKRILVAANALQCAVTLLLLFAHTSQWLWVIYAVAFIQSVVARFAGPAADAALPLIVGEERLVAANSALSVNNNLARLIGPSLGGALLVAVGLPGVVIADAASFLLAALLLLFLTLRVIPRADADGEAKAARGVWAEWTSGLRLILETGWLRTLFVVMGLAVLGDGIFTVLMAPFVSKVLHANAATFGWVMTARGLGGLAGGGVIGWLGKRLRPTRIIGLSAVLMGLNLAAIAWVAYVPATLALMALAGIPVVGFYVTLPTLIQTGAPDEYRGRIFGSYYAVNALMVLMGMLIASATGDRIGISVTITGAAILTVLAGIMALLILWRATIRPIGAIGAPQPLPDEARPASVS
jgi:MFS family permease